ncbi:MAG: branched-chain amino acid ABC transporter permease [Gammaproteobacteria bacterium]|nr:branched-chain amino acid ABC transporter permease [Gammaproteobacteria bacterium]MCY4218264.1 branched-chain amino acid ABC transporter permease [Gammaproteobacteria bacterium]
MKQKELLYFIAFVIFLIGVGLLQSWNVAFGILNMCLISAIMALGVNIQWGYAGLFNAGIMGFVALGGLSAVLVSAEPVGEAWSNGGIGIVASLTILVITIAMIFYVQKMFASPLRLWIIIMVILLGYWLFQGLFSAAVEQIESFNPAFAGYLGGLGLPITLSWIIGGLVAAGGAWLIGRISLGLRADYLAIATLGISEIIIAIIKYEEWLTRGVKNVTGLPRPVPYEINLVETHWFVDLAETINANPIAMASLFVKFCYFGLFLGVLAILMWFSERALKSPWGRMMRAIRDNRDAASAMGKDITSRHLQTFILGCAVCGIAGAMLVTLDGQLVPGSYTPLRYTFLIWVMVILGGSGNNWGSILGGCIIWFLWIQAEPLGYVLVGFITFPFEDNHWLKNHLVENAAQTRLILMGAILLMVMRFAPKGLIPER